ncbi:MAG: hypothetical protein GY820_27675 [Gammaproteobacteria bacterium]|nr:hypothetical protein [Gammaproteobacteria bacterium]
MGNRRRFQAYQNYVTQGNNPEIAQYYQIEEIGLIETSRGQGRRNLPRWVAMKLCQQCGEAKLTDIAREFHVGHDLTK